MPRPYLYNTLNMSNKQPNDTTPIKPSAWLSAIPFVSLISLLSCTLYVYGSDSLGGPSQIVLLTASGICIALGMGVCHVKWSTIERSISEKLQESAIAICILLLIGMLSASWMISGIVPTLICYGIQMIHPAVFLLSSCLICALVSLMSGSSWTTIATIGIALIGIGRALGFEDGWTAGAIISGAYFGDKISPLSDTTVLASSSSGTPLFQHIRYMMLTTMPSMFITLVIFGIAGIWIGSGNLTESVDTYTEALNNTFHISPWLLVVPIITGVLIYRKVPTLIVLFLSSIMAIILAIAFQGNILMQIGGSADGSFSFEALLRGIITTFANSTSVDTGNALLNDLVSTRGMGGMMDTIWLILSAMVFGGAMTSCGMLKSFLEAVFRRFMKTRLGLVCSTVFNGIAMNLMTGDQYISIILSSNMFKDEYTRQGYESRLLSRSTEDSATVVSVLIPWNTCGMTQATVLGVATLTYLPYTFFCLLSPLMSIIHAAFGWKIKRHEEWNKEGER